MSVAKKQKTIWEQLLSDMGTSMHMSASTVRNLYLCPISLLAKQFPEQFAKSYDLDVDKLDILIHDPATSKSIIKKIEDEKKQIEKELKKKKKEEDAKGKKARGSKKEKEPIVEETPSIDSFSSQEPGNPPEQPSTEPVEKDKKSSQSTLFSF
jgi:hypothetical protein